MYMCSARGLIEGTLRWGSGRICSFVFLGYCCVHLSIPLQLGGWCGGAVEGLGAHPRGGVGGPVGVIKPRELHVWHIVVGVDENALGVFLFVDLDWR